MKFMSEIKEICTVYLGNSMLDDDYTLYEDGQVKRFYDRNQWSLNNEEWVEVKNLSDRIKQKLLDKCPEDYKNKARQLLSL
ncbi:hypothetical protein D5R40_06430 [Okeania hirsuta]|uniref:Uncharacterized protein n=1 Tax=Okeania hirsuta TaxID=1458930 RepID=A0A3N6RMW6_9CYAN|nr:hypothetical protein D5R40_06430 [Okeania hirsuta]